MQIGPLVDRKILTVAPGQTLREVARKLNERSVGSAVVMAEDGQPGIITERDLLRSIADGADPDATNVEDYMTSTAITASASWDVVEAADRMLHGGFRHLVVLDNQARVTGVLSIRDLVASLMTLLERQQEHA